MKKFTPSLGQDYHKMVASVTQFSCAYTQYYASDEISQFYAQIYVYNYKYLKHNSVYIFMNVRACIILCA